MRGVVFQDVLRVAEVLLGCPPTLRRARFEEIMGRARQAAGTLSDAARGYPAGGPALLANPEYCACLSLVFGVLARGCGDAD